MLGQCRSEVCNGARHASFVRSMQSTASSAMFAVAFGERGRAARTPNIDVFGVVTSNRGRLHVLLLGLPGRAELKFVARAELDRLKIESWEPRQENRRG